MGSTPVRSYGPKGDSASWRHHNLSLQRLDFLCPCKTVLGDLLKAMARRVSLELLPGHCSKRDQAELGKPPWASSHGTAQERAGLARRTSM